MAIATVNTEPALTFDEARQRLNVSVRTMRRLVAERRIRHYRVGKSLRFYPSDLDAFMRAGLVEVAQ